MRSKEERCVKVNMNCAQTDRQTFDSGCIICVVISGGERC